MRFVIYGAGGIGGSLGARLHLNGNEVCLIARGAHFEAIQANGLQFHSPAHHESLNIPVVSHPQHLKFSDEDVVILCMKSQHTEEAVRDLQQAAPDSLPVICCQNGVASERIALRRFSRVYGMVVWVPAEHLEPGVVVNFAENKAGNLDAGCYPGGVDSLITDVTKAIDEAGFSSEPNPDIMPHKYAKLLVNLGNAFDAAVNARLPEVSTMLQEEGHECLNRAGIACSNIQAARSRRSTVQGGRVEGFDRHGSSTYQSMLRETGNHEVDYLNGEIVQLGRLHDVPTPANLVAQRVARQLLTKEIEPRSLSNQDVLKLIESERSSTS